MSVMDVRRLVRALGVGGLGFLFFGGAVGLVAAGGDSAGGGEETWLVPAPGPGDRATYKVDDRVFDQDAADPRYDVGPGMRLDVEWLPEGQALAEDGVLRATHPLATTLRYEGQDWELLAEVAYDAATGAPLVRSYRWNGVFEVHLDVGPVGLGQEAEGTVHGRRDLVQGPRGPCGLSADLFGRPVSKGDLVTVHGGCGIDEHATATPFVVHGWDELGERRFLRLDSPSGLSIHYDPAYPVPVRVEARMPELWGNDALVAGRVTILRLAAFHEGQGDYAAPAPSPPVVPPAPVPLAPRTPWMVDETGVEHPFPLSAAHAAALDPASYRDGDETVPEFLEEHPRAYLAVGWGVHMEDSRGSTYPGWALLWTDGDDAIAKSVVLYPTAIVAAVPVPGAPTYPVVGEWQTDLAEDPDEYFPTPSAVPGAFPALAGVWDQALRVLEPHGLAANSYSFVVTCDSTCQQAAPLVYAGHTHYSAFNFDSALQDQQGRTFLLAADGDGRPASYFRLDSETQAPFPVLPADEAPVDPPAAAPRFEAAFSAWPVPGAKAATSIGVVATLLGALYYFWPAVKGGFLGLFSRIEPDRVLDHPARKALHALVEANPGIHFQEIVRRTGFGRGQLEHHLRKLERAELVSRVKGDSYACFFARGQVDRRVMAAAPLLRSDGGRSVLAALQQRPGASSRELAAQLGLATGTVSYHVKRLREAGMLESAGGALHLTETGRKATALAA